MSTRRNLNLLLAGSLLLTLASCGNDKKSRPQKQINPVCAEMNCLSSVNWKMLLQGRAFPDKTRIDINGTTVLNECVSKQKYAINRYAQPQSFYLENYYVPKRGDLKIDVIDLGHCDSETTFINDEKVHFEVVKEGDNTEIVINL
jgi:hypothetical protein